MMCQSVDIDSLPQKIYFISFILKEKTFCQDTSFITKLKIAKRAKKELRYLSPESGNTHAHTRTHTTIISYN